MFTVSELYDRILAGEYASEGRYPDYGLREQDIELYRQLVVAYNTDVERLVERFKADALEALGLTNHPKADELLRIAWDEGHSGGYADVLSYMEELSVLLL